MRAPLRIAAPLLALIGATLVGVLPASAHERRTVSGYNFVVGFVKEPTLLNEANGIDLRISDASTNEPVTSGVNLTALVTGGTGQTILRIRDRGTAPGAYTADLTPDRTGQYTFKFNGTINGVPIDTTFESGPGRFNDVTGPEPAPAQPAAPSPRLPDWLTGIFGDIRSLPSSLGR